MLNEQSPSNADSRETVSDEQVTVRFVRRVTSLPDGRRLTLYARPAGAPSPRPSP